MGAITTVDTVMEQAVSWRSSGGGVVDQEGCLKVRWLGRDSMRLQTDSGDGREAEIKAMNHVRKLLDLEDIRVPMWTM